LLLGIAVVVFFLTRLAPGDPIDVLLGDYPASPEYEEELRARYGLDSPLYVQFGVYVRNLATGDFGYSLPNRAPVFDLIMIRLPATILLMGSGLLLATLVGIPLGIIASLRPNSALDGVTSFVAVVGYSVPVFLVGQVFLVVFAAGLGWFPIQGMHAIRGGSGVWDVLWHLFLPMVALSLRYTAINTRMTRASMIEELDKDYIVTARAKGLSGGAVVIRHGLRNALIPVVTVVGYNFGALLSGSVLVETVFGWPGIGRLLFDSLTTRDTPTIVAILVIGGAMALVANLATDISYAVLNPRIRYGGDVLGSL
jgi:peptide/nickel transport system permease protein